MIDEKKAQILVNQLRKKGANNLSPGELLCLNWNRMSVLTNIRCRRPLTALEKAELGFRNSIQFSFANANSDLAKEGKIIDSLREHEKKYRGLEV